MEVKLSIVCWFVVVSFTLGDLAAETCDIGNGVGCASEDEHTGLTQLRVSKHRFSAPHVKPTPIPTFITCGAARGDFGPHFGISYDIPCMPGSCCPMYGRTYACPGSTTSKCQFAEIQGDQTLVETDDPTFEAKGYPPRPPHKAYGDVELPGGQSLTNFLELEPGIRGATICNRTTDCFKEAFHNIATGPWAGLQYVWGDLGPSMNPGFGGIRTYNAVELKLRGAVEPLVMYHIGGFNRTNASQVMCDIWWGAASTYEGKSLLQASINVQTNTEYPGIVRCEFADPNVPLVAVMGQGWDENMYGYQWRGSVDDYGVAVEGNRVARELVSLGYPGASDGILQYLLPACGSGTVKHARPKCMGCPITNRTRDNITAPFSDPEAFGCFGIHVPPDVPPKQSGLISKSIHLRRR